MSHFVVLMRKSVLKFDLLITSHRMEKTEAGLKGLCIREILTK